MAGKVAAESEEYFGEQRQVFVSASDAVQEVVARCPGIVQRVMTLPSTEVIDELMVWLKLVNPLIGGDAQVVQVDAGGSRWISHDPERIQLEALAQGTAIFDGTATFAYQTNGPFVQVGSAGVVFGDNFTSPRAR